jgi:hypothetical protein
VTEVDERRPFTIDDDVGRLDIAVHDLRRGGRLESAHQEDTKAPELNFLEGPALVDKGVKTDESAELHRDVRASRLRFDELRNETTVEQLQDVGLVCQGGNRSGVASTFFEKLQGGLGPVSVGPNDNRRMTSAEFAIDAPSVKTLREPCPFIIQPPSGAGQGEHREGGDQKWLRGRFPVDDQSSEGEDDSREKSSSPSSPS